MNKITLSSPESIAAYIYTILYRKINVIFNIISGQKAIRNARREIRRVPTNLLEYINNDNGNEYRFWEELCQACLTPEIVGFDGNTELKEKLVELRNSSLMVFLVANTLWMIIILVLVKQNNLKALGVDVIGLSFLFVYGTIIILQFLAMITHRLTTLLHVLARAPWICCRPSNKPIEQRQ
jgi:chitin synthase